MPAVHAQLRDVARRLEAHLRDMQDLEFTVQQGRLYLLQTRSGKRTTQAAVRIAVHLAEEGVVTPEEAVDMVDMEALTICFSRCSIRTLPAPCWRSGWPPRQGR